MAEVDTGGTLIWRLLHASLCVVLLSLVAASAWATVPPGITAATVGPAVLGAIAAGWKAANLGSRAATVVILMSIATAAAIRMTFYAAHGRWIAVPVYSLMILLCSWVMFAVWVGWQQMDVIEAMRTQARSMCGDCPCSVLSLDEQGQR